jgi:hypothetical protein
MTEIKKTVFGLEAIAHQDAAFFKELAAAFRPICLNRLSGSDLELHNDVSAKVARLLKQRTNITITLNLNKDRGPNAWVYPPQLNRNHSLYQDGMKHYITNIDGLKHLNKAADKMLQGTLDHNKVWVTGIFSEISCPVDVTLGLLNMATAEEVAAIFLHEIGHVWSYFELLTLAAKTNLALRTVRQEFLNADAETKIVIVRESASALGFTAEEIEAIQKSKSVDRVEVAVINSQVRASYSELGFSLYDQRGWEFASDQFSTRMGGGAHVVTGLDKMHRKYGDPVYRSLFTHVVGNVIETFSFILLSVGTAGLFPLLMLVIGDPFCQGEIYDRPKERFTRVKHELIAYLRNSSTDKTRVAEVLNDLATIDKALSKMQDRYGVGYYFWALISPAGRRNRNNVAVQQALEVLANNELYVAAAQLRTM